MVQHLSYTASSIISKKKLVKFYKNPMLASTLISDSEGQELRASNWLPWCSHIQNHCSRPEVYTHLTADLHLKSLSGRTAAWLSSAVNIKHILQFLS